MPEKARVRTRTRMLEKVGVSRLRSIRQVRAQWAAAQAYSATVAGLAQASHQYTAGQAATLAWLLGQAAEPLTFRPAEGRPDRAQVVALEQHARSVAQTASGIESVSSRPYAVGVECVCRWVRKRGDPPPIPRPGRSPK